jgi:hypothetical protein
MLRGSSNCKELTLTSAPRTLVLLRVWFAAAMLAACPLPGWAESAVIVVDRHGPVALVSPDALLPLATLATLAFGSGLQLDPASSVTLLYIATGDEYTVTGPGTARIDPAGVSSGGGASVQRRPPDSAKPVQLRVDALAMGGMVMRGGGVRARSPAGLVVASPSQLSWDSLASQANYRVVLHDASGTPLFEQVAQGLKLAFPKEVQLKPDEQYTWTVTRETEAGAVPGTSASFRLASQALREQAAKLQPDDSTIFADRLIYALWLEQIGATGEARDMWQSLADQRPGDDALIKRAHR